MNKLDHLLVILMEECAEIQYAAAEAEKAAAQLTADAIHIVGKALRGISSF